MTTIISLSKMPTQLTMTLATHMATYLLEVSPSMEAVNRPHQPSAAHCSVVLHKEDGSSMVCRGGIDPDLIVTAMSSALALHESLFLEILPAKLKQLTPQHVQQQLKEFR